MHTNVCANFLVAVAIGSPSTQTSVAFACENYAEKRLPINNSVYIFALFFALPLPPMFATTSRGARSIDAVGL
jgi:hypothetical protein